MSWIRTADVPPDAPTQTEVLMQNLAEWAQDTFLDEATGKYAFNWEQVKEQGRQLGLAENEIEEVIADMKRIEGSQVTAGAPGDGPVSGSEKLNALLDNVPPQAGQEFTVATEYAASIRDAILELMEGGSASPEDENKYARMLGEVTTAFQEATKQHQSAPVLAMVEQLKEIRKEASVAQIASAVLQASQVVPQEKPVESSMIREVFEQSLRQCTTDGRDLQWIWPLVRNLDTTPIHANTAHTDPQATIRAAFLMGQCTCELWRKAVAEVKKECGPEIKKKVDGLAKWGTVKPSRAAVRDIVIKALEAKMIYPYPDFVQEIMHALGFNPGSESGYQTRGLGPETDRSPQRES